MRNLFIAAFLAIPIYIACKVYVAWVSVDLDDEDWPFEDDEDEGAFLM